MRRETEQTGQGWLHFGQRSAVVRYVFWRREGSNNVGNGVVFGKSEDFIEAMKLKGVTLELATDGALSIWIDSVRRDEASFYTE